MATAAGVNYGDHTTHSVEILDNDVISKLNRKQYQEHLIPSPKVQTRNLSRRSSSINKSTSLSLKYEEIVHLGDCIEDKL